MEQEQVYPQKNLRLDPSQHYLTTKKFYIPSYSTSLRYDSREKMSQKHKNAATGENETVSNIYDE